MIEDEIPNKLGIFGEFWLKFNQFDVKKAQNLPVSGLKFRQIGNFLGTRIVRVFGQKYSMFE